MQVVPREAFFNRAQPGLEGRLLVALLPTDGQFAVIGHRVFRRGFWCGQHKRGTFIFADDDNQCLEVRPTSDTDETASRAGAVKSTVPTSPRTGSTIFSLELCGYCEVRLRSRPAYVVSSGLPHTRIASGEAFCRSAA